MTMLTTLRNVELVYSIALSFGSMLLLDMLWVKYTHAMMQHRALAAGLWAGGITACLAIVTVSYVENPWMVIPTVAGSVVGTYIATRLETPGKAT
jgi:hypothetical protein